MSKTMPETDNYDTVMQMLTSISLMCRNMETTRKLIVVGALNVAAIGMSTEVINSHLPKREEVAK